VLHLSHDAAEGPEIAAQYRGLIHQPDGMGDAARLLQDFHEGGAIDRVATEGAVHHIAAGIQRAQRARRQTRQPSCCSYMRKVSRMACGSRSYRSSLTTSMVPAFSQKRSLS
jgi:hypothetical protein